MGKGGSVVLEPIDRENLRARVHIVHNADADAAKARKALAAAVELLVAEGVPYSDIIAAVDDMTAPCALRLTPVMDWKPARLEAMVRRYRTEVGIVRPGSGRRARVRP